MQIFVKDIKAGRTFALDLEAGCTTEQVKQCVADSQGIGVEQQRLIFRGKTLQAGETLAQAGVQKESTLHMVLRLQGISITINVRLMSGRTLIFEVQPTATAKSVKETVQELVKLPADSHTLNFTSMIPDEGSLAEWGVSHSSTLWLIAIPEKPFSTRPGSPGSSAGSPVHAIQGEERDRTRVYGELGSLYARCGGIFGIASFVDRCMDKWMVDEALNANAAVATWHDRAQRCGFKFLVTQLMGYLAGGPQRYTGRSMADSHKHLNINLSEWSCFMNVFHQVCGEFGLPDTDTEDLAAILNSMKSDCVVQPGEVAPPFPAPVSPSGTSLYSKVGGVYPLALFVDRLVDALLADKRVNVPIDGQKRNEASLKYLLTEIVCSAAGGNEVITAVDFKETRLLLPAKKMFFVLDAAKAASDHLDSSALRVELIQRLSELEHLIVDPSRSPAVPPQYQERRVKVQQLAAMTGVAILYVPRGGVVILDFAATPEQLTQARAGLAELGLVSAEKSKVKSAAEAASGNMFSSAAIAARYSAPGTFVAARKRVHGDPRTLYGQGGGVFGLAKLVDRMMDVWMADPRLNANDMVARWHISQQRCGFKFLVTQIFGYLTGGPQRYTGQPMDVAHKHLNIDSSQWDSFMLGADKVFRELKVDPATQKDLRAIITSFKDDVIVRKGENVPADPGLCRKPPIGKTLYAQAGGVYPLAQFTDLLVDKATDRHGKVKIPFDPSFKRTTPGLKYLATELVCSCAGGPEVVTSRGYDDAKLGVPAEDWPFFLEMVAEAAAAVWPASTLIQQSVQAAIQDQKAEFCIGLVADDQASVDASRHMLMKAGHNHFEVSAALDRCGGDGQQALDLLASGWTPPAAVQAAPSTNSTQPRVCPFSGAVTGGVCPFSGAVAEGDAHPASKVRRVNGGYSSPRESCSKSCESSSSASSQFAGRVLGDPMQKELDDLLVEDPDLVCPITLMLLLDPVIASDGCVYERMAVAELSRAQGVSPITRAPLTGQVVAASDHVAKVRAFMNRRCTDLIGFVARAKKQGRPLMAMTAIDRLKDYIAALSPQSEPHLAKQCVDLCLELGRVPPSFNSPQERISRVLKDQVARAKAEGESVLQERSAACGSEKSVVFCVDTSGSMRGSRIEKARENLLMIFDQYMEDEDSMSLVSFSNSTETRIDMQEIAEGRRSRLRCMIDAGFNVGGGTAFWDAISTCVETLKQSPPAQQQWIVALTDGEDRHSKRHTLESARAAVQAAEGNANLIVIGIQLSPGLKPDMQRLCTATEKSIFIDASGDLSSLDAAFQQVAEMICE